MKYILLIVITIFVITGISAQNITLKIAYENKEQPPYYLGNSEYVLSKPGVAVEMILALEDKIPELSITLTRLPWSRCLNNLKHGQLDGIFNASFKEERLELGMYPWIDGKVDPNKRITTISYNFYKLKGSETIWDGEKIINLKKRVGAPLGYSVVGDLEKLGVNVDETPSSYQNLKKLVAKRIDLAALQTVTGDAILSIYTEEFKNIVKIEPPFKTKPYYLMLSKQFVQKYPKVAKKIWDAIEEIREDDFDKIAKKYIN